MRIDRRRALALFGAGTAAVAGPAARIPPGRPTDEALARGAKGVW